ncbi:MAG: HDOD domain-containing protein [Proteobacteria bacterium]|nr:HDOD domain-containing protein [Pseudomonadota bacterium]
MVRQTLINRAAALKIIPSLQGIVDTVIKILNDSNSSAKGLSDVIRYDLSLSSKIISIANSAYYNRGVEIFSLPQAIINIGFQETKSIIVCLLFMENIRKTLKLRDEDLLTFWKHSIYVACSAKVLSEKTLAEEPQKVYISSLLHDIGKIVFYAEVDNYNSIVCGANTNGNSLNKIENNIFGIDHQEIGHIIAMKWKLPEAISHVIRYHHEQQPFEEEYKHLVKITQTADRFLLNPDYHADPESLILLKEKENIEREIKKHMEVLNINC